MPLRDYQDEIGGETGSVVIGVNVGGTTIEVGSVDERHRVLRRAKAASAIAVGVGIQAVVHNGRAVTVLHLIGWTENVELVGP